MNYNHIKPETMIRYLADELNDQEKHLLENHLAVCPECAAKLDEQRRLEGEIRASVRNGHTETLSPDSRIEIGTEHCRKNEPDSDTALWNARIRRNAAVQIGAVVAVTVFLIVLTVFPKQKGKPDAVPVPAGTPVETQTGSAPEERSPDAVQEEGKEEVSAVPDVSSPAETKPEETVDSAVPEKTSPFRFEQDKGLVQFFAPEKIRLNPGRRHVLKGIESPFGENVCIVFADCGDTVRPTVIPAENAVVVSSFHRFAGGEMLCAAIRSSEPLSTPAHIRLEKADEGKATVLPVHILPSEDFSKQDPAVRMSALLLAVCSRDLLKDRETRRKIREEMERLAETEYGADPAVSGLIEKLKQIK